MTEYPVTDRTLVGGRWLVHQGEFLPVFRPTDGSVLAKIPGQHGDDVDAAVRAARDGLRVWSATDPAERADALWTLAQLLREDRDNLAEIVCEDVGTPRRIAESVQVDLPIKVLETTAGIVRSKKFDKRIGNSIVLEVPVGVVGAITPWNYPLHQSIAKISAALAAGCTVVHKPSEIAPLVLLRLAELIDRAGLPPGIYNQVSGLGSAVGSALVEHPLVDKISFTGSTAVGKRVASRAVQTMKRISMELGGKSASLIMPEADLPLAVKATVNNAFLNSGQTCTAWTRLLVPERQYEEAIDLAAGFAVAVESRLGPLASESQFDKVQAYIDGAIRAGARIAAGGKGRPDGRSAGYFARATVVADVSPLSPIAQEEIFGPVLCIIPYKNISEAIEIANGTEYGLAGAVWGPLDAAVDVARSMRAGQVDVNGGPFNPSAPFGGFKSSGIGRELGEHGIDGYLEPMAIQTSAIGR